MADFNSNFKKILQNLENNIKDKEALEAAKVEIFNLYNFFLDEITELEQTMNKKLLAIAESQLHVEEQIKTMNKSIKNIETIKKPVENPAIIQYNKNVDINNADSTPP